MSCAISELVSKFTITYNHNKKTAKYLDVTFFVATKNRNYPQQMQWFVLCAGKLHVQLTGLFVCLHHSSTIERCGGTFSPLRQAKFSFFHITDAIKSSKIHVIWLEQESWRQQQQQIFIFKINQKESFFLGRDIYFSSDDNNIL